MQNFFSKMMFVQSIAFFCQSYSNTQEIVDFFQDTAILSAQDISKIHNYNAEGRREWIKNKASKLAPGTKVLDVGAGTCRYREFFKHCQYVTQDFCQNQVSVQYENIDIVSDATKIPVPDNSFDVIVCTEVLEHVPEPILVLQEMSRIVRPGGKIFLTAPLGCGRHQMPYHFYGGYTPEWYEHFGKKFGLILVELVANGGFFKFLGQECARVSWTFESHAQYHGKYANFIKKLFGTFLPRYLYALEERCLSNDRITAGYFVTFEKKI